MEKKRRARINESLLELRTLLADTDVSPAQITCSCSLQVQPGSNSSAASFHSFIPRWRTQRCWR